MTRCPCEDFESVDDDAFPDDDSECACGHVLDEHEEAAQFFRRCTVEVDS